MLLAPPLLAQTARSPNRGKRLRRVHRLLPVALPPGGLVPFQADVAWGLSDTLGNLKVRAIFEDEVFFTHGYFAPTTLENLKANRSGIFSLWWQQRHGDSDVWLNAQGQYLVATADKPAYREADGSLVAKPLRRNLARLLYAYEWESGGAATDRQAQWKARRWKKTAGYVRYLGGEILAVRGPSTRRYFRQIDRRNHRYPVPHPPPAMGPPQALFTTSGHQLTAYRYERLFAIRDGRIAYQSASGGPLEAGYLNKEGVEVLQGFASAGPFCYNRAVVQMATADGQPGGNYALIDTTGAYIIPPQPGRLFGPDSAGFVRRDISRTEEHSLTEYLTLAGQPAFPGKLFGWGEEFVGETAQVADTTGRPGILHRDGSWEPSNQKALTPRPPEPTARVLPIDSTHFQLQTAAGVLLNDAKVYAWAEPLAGGWFAARTTAASPVVLISPEGAAVALPPGCTPDLRYHSPRTYNRVPFEDGLVKVEWEEIGRTGKFTRHAYLTRSGRLLVGDTE